MCDHSTKGRATRRKPDVTKKNDWMRDDSTRFSRLPPHVPERQLKNPCSTSLLVFTSSHCAYTPCIVDSPTHSSSDRWIFRLFYNSPILTRLTTVSSRRLAFLIFYTKLGEFMRLHAPPPPKKSIVSFVNCRLVEYFVSVTSKVAAPNYCLGCCSKEVARLIRQGMQNWAFESILLWQISIPC